MLSPTNFRIHSINIKDIVTRMESGENFAFAKALHGYWERLYHVSSDLTLEGIKRSLNQICQNNKQFYDFRTTSVPKDQIGTRELFGVLERDIDWHYLDLLDMIREPNEVLWGVHYDGFPQMSCRLNDVRRSSIEAMQAVLSPDRIYHDGRIWKDACLNGSIIELLDYLRDTETTVVVVGLEHLLDINENKYWRFDYFRFEQVDYIPLSPRRIEFVEYLVQRHVPQRSVYLMQLGMLTPWVVCKAFRHMPHAWLIDVGKALDFFCDPNCRPYLPFIEKVEWSVYNELDNRRDRGVRLL